MRCSCRDSLAVGGVFVVSLFSRAERPRVGRAHGRGCGKRLTTTRCLADGQFILLHYAPPVGKKIATAAFYPLVFALFRPFWRLVALRLFLPSPPSSFSPQRNVFLSEFSGARRLSSGNQRRTALPAAGWLCCPWRRWWSASALYYSRKKKSSGGKKEDVIAVAPVAIPFPISPAFAVGGGGAECRHPGGNASRWSLCRPTRSDETRGEPKEGRLIRCAMGARPLCTVLHLVAAAVPNRLLLRRSRDSYRRGARATVLEPSRRDSAYSARFSPLRCVQWP